MKNFKITSAIFNEIEEVEFNSTEAYEEYYSVMYKLAENELCLSEDEKENMSNDELQENIDDEMNNIISVKRIHKEGLLFHALLKWYNRNENHNLNDYSLKVLENVRSAVLDDEYLYYVTGYGYDTISSDLLGGTSDGQAKYDFLKWINE